MNKKKKYNYKYVHFFHTHSYEINAFHRFDFATTNETMYHAKVGHVFQQTI